MAMENRICIGHHTSKEIIDLLGHHPPAQVDFQNVASLLRKCGITKDLSEGKRLHAYLIKRGLNRHLLLGNLLLQMYVKCASLHDVVDSFSSMHQRNRFSWNFLITAYARHGQYDQAVCAFQRLQCEGFLPNEFIFASVISACATKTSMLDGKRIHTLLVESGFHSSIAVVNALVNMYGRCSCLTEARRLFDQVLDRNVVSWTGMISTYSHHGYGKDAFFLFNQMHQEGVLPNQVTFISMLDACAIHEWLGEGKRVHAYIMGSGLESEIVLATGLVNMYGKCGCLNDAFESFICLTERTTTLWTAMIWGCIQQDQTDKALQLYRRMLLEGVLPDIVTYSSVFDGCTFQEALIIGKQVHATMVADGLDFNIVTTTSLLNMYGRCGAVTEARCIFDRMEVRNSVSWTSLIASYVQYGDSKEAIQLFKQMQREGAPPDKVTFWSVVDACADEAAIDEGILVHGLIMANGLDSDSGLATALINMYGKCGELSEARDMFDSMPEKNLVSWTAMITAYAQYGCDREALLLYDQMQQEGMTPNRVTFIAILSACASEAHLVEGKRIHISITNSEFHHDVVVMTALVNMYGKCASQEDARRVFDEMKERNVISWNTMLSAYSHCGYSEEALELFEQMQFQAITPNKATFMCILDACASEATLCKGKFMHALAFKSGFDLDVDVGNAIVNMYGKCGRLQDAHKIFKQIHEWDAISWNTMIGLLAQHGHSKAALTMFKEMLAKGHLPDNVTFVAVLSACGHAGLVVEGLHYFIALMTAYGIALTAEHCHCMIHMFARSGLMQEGESFVEKVPFQPTSVTWMSLLNACKGHPDMGRGEYAVQHVIELDEENSFAYVMLSNIYAACKCRGEYASDLICINEIDNEAVGS